MDSCSNTEIETIVSPDSVLEEENISDETAITEEIGDAFLMAVPTRLRNLSTLEYYRTAIDLRARIINLTQSQAIPKSLRGAFSVPMCNTARDMVSYIVKADHYFPNTEEHVQLRKDCYAAAEACVDMLAQDLQTLFEHQRKYRITKVKVKSILEILRVCDQETKLLKGTRKNVKLR